MENLTADQSQPKQITIKKMIAKLILSKPFTEYKNLTDLN